MGRSHCPSAHRRGLVSFSGEALHCVQQLPPGNTAMTTDTRIESLETQVRTLKRMLFGVFGLVVVGGLLAATSLQSVPDVIQAKQF